MRLVLWAGVAFAILWSGLWITGYVAIKRTVPAWAEERRAEGWQVDWTALHLRGFPSRFDTTFDDLAIADPNTGWSWSGPFFQLLALTYRPTHFIAVWPNTHVLRTPVARSEISHEKMQASLVLTASTSPQLNRTTFVVDQPVITLEHGTLAAQTVRFATRRTEGEPLSHDIALQVVDLQPPAALKAQLDPTGLLPATLEALRLDMTIGFDAPWDRDAFEHRRPQPTSLTLRDARATWGGLDLRFAGAVQIDSFGQPSGKITLKATNWREILDIAQRAGSIGPNTAGLLRGALTGLSGLSGPSTTLDIPLTVTRGQILVGIVPVGRIAPLVLR